MPGDAKPSAVGRHQAFRTPVWRPSPPPYPGTAPRKEPTDLVNDPSHQPRPQRLVLTLMALVMAGLCLWGGSRGGFIPGQPFKDPDDVLRMLQVLALHDGGAWYDLTQPRINPPTGLAMHWSRLPDLPLLGRLRLAEPWLGREGAIRFAALGVPVLLGIAYFLALVWAARPLTGAPGMPLAGLVALTAYVPHLAYQAGRVDHHGWQLLLALLIAGALLRLAAGERRRGPALLGGGCTALALWIGAEAIPVLACAAAALTLVWWREGQWAADRLALWGLTALAGALLILPLALAPGQRASMACDAFSLVSLALTAALAGFGLAAARAERWFGPLTLGRRMGFSLVLGGALVGLLGAAFPHCLAGPYGELSPEIVQLVAQTRESRPLGRLLFVAPAAALYYLALPLAGLALAIWLARTGSAAQRTLWLALLVLMAGAFLLPWWQLRGSLLANAYATLTLTWLAATLGAKADRQPSLPRRVALRGGVPLLVAILPLTLALAVGSITPQSALEKQDACDISQALAVLNQAPYRAQAPLLIAAPVNQAATILWLTPHAVLGAPYHRNDVGLRDNDAILYKGEGRSLETVSRRGVKLILICSERRRLPHDVAGTTPISWTNLWLEETKPEWLESILRAGDAFLYQSKIAEVK